MLSNRNSPPPFLIFFIFLALLSWVNFLLHNLYTTWAKSLFHRLFLYYKGRLVGWNSCPAKQSAGLYPVWGTWVSSMYRLNLSMIIILLHYNYYYLYMFTDNGCQKCLCNKFTQTLISSNDIVILGMTSNLWIRHDHDQLVYDCSPIPKLTMDFLTSLSCLCSQLAQL